MKHISIFLACVFGMIMAQGVHAEVTKETVVDCAESTCFPSAFDFTLSGKMFYATRSGEIHVFNPKTEEDLVWYTLPSVSVASEQGLLGLALDPRWPEQKWVYLFYTHGDPLENRVIRIRKIDDDIFERDRLMTIPATNVHDGGVIHFGPDGKLYIITGDAQDPANAQDLDVPHGKILRVTKRGNIPSDNPFSESAVFSYGHRNSFGFTFDPLDPHLKSVEVWETENGPECNDEMNRAVAGKNYGWGSEQDCPDTNQSGTDIHEPKYTWESVVAVTGSAFCSECSLGSEYEGDLIVGAWKTGQLFNLSLNTERTAVENIEEIYDNDQGILAVEAKDNGRVFFSDPSGIYKLTTVQE